MFNVRIEVVSAVVAVGCVGQDVFAYDSQAFSEKLFLNFQLLANFLHLMSKIWSALGA